jgi:hypothetical protein
MVSSFQEAAALAVAVMSPTERARPRYHQNYFAEWVAIGAGARVRRTITIRGEHDYWLTGLTYVTEATNLTADLIDIRVSGRSLFDRETFAFNMMPGQADSREGFPMPFPYRYQAKTLIEIFVTNADVAPASMRLVMHGLAVER